MGILENTIFRRGIENFRFLQENLRKIASSKSRFYYGGFAKAGLGKIAVKKVALLNAGSIPVGLGKVASFLGRTKARNCLPHVRRGEVTINTYSRYIGTPEFCFSQNCPDQFRIPQVGPL
jgi:hypothetical protein